MKFVVDENEIALLVQPLRLLYPEHEWIHVRDLNLVDMDDVEVFHGLAQIDATALITRDTAQLRRTNEWRTLESLGIHWIGHAEPKGSGTTMAARVISNYTSAMPHIIAAIPQVSQPCAFKVKGRSDNFGSCLAVRELSTRREIKFDREGQRSA